jgi:hypothetical protein
MGYWPTHKLRLDATSCPARELLFCGGVVWSGKGVSSQEQQVVADNPRHGPRKQLLRQSDQSMTSYTHTAFFGLYV